MLGDYIGGVERKERRMKKVAALLVGLTLVAGVAAPAFAQSTWKNCPFQDSSLCKVESIGSLNND